MHRIDEARAACPQLPPHQNAPAHAPGATTLSLALPPGARPITASRPTTLALPGGATPPWESKSVMKLANRIGRADPEAEPMLVEGRAGTVLAAVGSSRDHQVAGQAISQHGQAQLGAKLERAAEYKAELEQRSREQRRLAHAPGGGSSTDAAVKPRLAATGAVSGGPPAHERPPAGTSLTVRRNNHAGGGHGSRALVAGGGSGALVADDAAPWSRGANEMSFGAVYEYRDPSGKPTFVGSTEQMPESRWQEDYGNHSKVRALAHAGGSANVVWAGVGRGPCGAGEMQAAREAVATDRAQRQRLVELQGAKPYSRHAHMLT